MANDDDATESTGRPKGPLGVDPLHFSIFCFGALVLFVLYLLFPRALRKQYFGGYPKRHAWSARSRARRGGRSYGQVRSLVVVTASQIAHGQWFLALVPAVIWR